MTQKIICLTGGQRTGTTVLQQAIAAGGNARNYGEIFQVKEGLASHRHRSFHDFASEKGILLADVIQARGASAIGRQYLDWLKEGAGRRHVLIDVKLNSWMALCPAWQYPHEEPVFLKLLQAERAAFVLLRRRKLADQMLSLFISRRLGIWHNLTRERVAGRVLSAPIAELERVATLTCRSEAAMQEYLREYPHRIAVWYEELYEEGMIGQPFRDSFRAMTAIELPVGKLTIQPNTPHKREIVENYAEAVAAIDAIAARYRYPEPGAPVLSARLRRA